MQWIGGPKKRDAASVLLAFVEAESRMNKSFIKTMKRRPSRKTISNITTPEGLKWQHDPSVPRALFERVAKLEPEIVRRYLGAHLQMYEQCGSARDLVVNRITIEQGAHRVDAGVLHAYLTILEAFEKLVRPTPGIDCGILRVRPAASPLRRQKRTKSAFIEPMQCKPVTALPTERRDSLRSNSTAIAALS